MSLVAIVGRPNVGKSTLFNRLVGRRVAIVEDWAGVTRDRNYAETDMDGCLVTLVDTGGLDPEADDPLIGSMAGQVEQAVDEADLILFVVDVQEGLLAPDIEIADYLRRRTKDVLIVVNKVDGEKQETAATEFYSLGFETLHSVSAEHRRGIGDLIDDIVERISSLAEEEGIEDDAVRVAVLGRPNVGKSSLVNNLLGADRVVVSPIAGTTRDAIDTRVVVDDTPYLLIDTAGIRRKSKVEIGVEKWSVMKAIRSIDRAQVCLVLVDAQEGLTDQDLRVLDLIFRGGRGAIICLNKWDIVEKDGRTFDEIKKDIIFRLGPHRHVPIISMSALTGQRVRKVFERVNQVVQEGEKRVSTSKLNDFLADALRTLTPPVIGRKKTRLYYVTQVRSAPPVFVFFCSYPDGIPVHYERYLVNRLRAQFGFDGVPIRIIFRQRRRNADEEQSQ